MNADEILKQHTKSRADVFLESLTQQARTDAMEIALQTFPRLREMSPEEQKQEIEKVIGIMEENNMILTPENAIRAGKLLEVSERVDEAAWMEQTGYKPKSREFPKFDTENPDGRIAAEAQQKQDEYARGLSREEMEAFYRAKYEGVSQAPAPAKEERPKTRTPDVLYYDSNGFPVFSEVR